MDYFFNTGGVVAGVIVSQIDTGDEILNSIIAVLTVIYICFCFIVKLKSYLSTHSKEEIAEEVKNKIEEIVEKKIEEKKNEKKDE